MEDRISARLDSLEQRLAKLEHQPSSRRSDAPGVRAHPPGIGPLIEWLEAQVQEPGSAFVAYAGAGPWEAGTVAWQIGRSWDEILSLTGPATASLLSALANPTRIRIVAAVLRGSHTTSELTETLDQPSSGQLFHHLKDLIAAGVIHQPLRGVYAVRPQHVVALLTIMCAALDIVTADVEPDGTDEP